MTHVSGKRTLLLSGSFCRQSLVAHLPCGSVCFAGERFFQLFVATVSAAVVFNGPFILEQCKVNKEVQVAQALIFMSCSSTSNHAGTCLSEEENSKFARPVANMLLLWRNERKQPHQGSYLMKIERLLSRRFAPSYSRNSLYSPFQVHKFQLVQRKPDFLLPARMHWKRRKPDWSGFNAFHIFSKKTHKPR